MGVSTLGLQILIMEILKLYRRKNGMRDLRGLALYCNIEACLPSVRNNCIGRAMVSTPDFQVQELEHPVPGMLSELTAHLLAEEKANGVHQ